MATVTLLSATSAGNPVGVSQVVPPVTRGLLTFSITGPLSNYAQTTVLYSSDGGQDYLTAAVLQIISGGPNTVSQELRFPAIYTLWDANLDTLTPGAGITATVTLTT